MCSASISPTPRSMPRGARSAPLRSAYARPISSPSARRLSTSSTSAHSCARCHRASGRAGRNGSPSCCARAVCSRDSSSWRIRIAARPSASRSAVCARCSIRASRCSRTSRYRRSNRCRCSPATSVGRCGSGGYDGARMLIGSGVLYLLVTIAIGLWAAQRVHTSKDYVLAGRSLPLYMNTATVFATWFGAESVLSVSVEFSKSGLGGIIADPFGSSMCLVIVALFFARAFYRMDLLTIGDFYRKRYGPTMELGTSVVIAISYLGWTAAQLTALGLVLSTLTDGAISLSTGIIISGIFVLAYTIWGGMWSVAMTDLFQSVMIIVGLVLVAWVVGDMAGGSSKVIAAALEGGRFEFWPKGGTREWFAFVTAFLTLAIGSIPQQDIFQRVTSAKDERTAIIGSLLGGVVYFCFVFVPIFIVLAALMVDPSLGSLLKAEDVREMQRVLPNFILEHTPLWIKVLFFGALLSAILSTASGAIIAPTSLCTENIIRPRFPHMSERQFMLSLRLVLVSFTLAALIFALNSKQTMYDMVQNAYTVTLVAALVPLAAGIFWKRSSNTGAILSSLFGLVSWVIAAFTAPDATVPPPLVGLAFSLFGMVAGSLLPRPLAHAQPHGRHH